MSYGSKTFHFSISVYYFFSYLFRSSGRKLLRFTELYQVLSNHQAHQDRAIAVNFPVAFVL